ncbi:hypothetical protein GCM10010911_59610 [Paenibacillus nasutitermitis]|uniref:Uncharacterized protein n=1 Tax=Paenibacillus nasutitermitis TaxID=1652958 RepID=A0A917E1P7_9BACL|nr:hypothetical protein GCM10010911_59610 [Paenibacillus nasutitermitis]
MLDYGRGVKGMQLWLFAGFSDWLFSLVACNGPESSTKNYNGIDLMWK